MAGDGAQQVRGRAGGEVRHDRLGRVGRGQRVAHRLLGEAADVAERDARAAAEQATVDLTAERRAARRPVGVDVVHERPGLEAVAIADCSPSLTSAPAREAARSVAKCHARGVEAGSSRCRSAKVGIAASGGMLVARDLDQLSDAVELVGLGRERLAVVPARSRSSARARSTSARTLSIASASSPSAAPR